MSVSEEVFQVPGSLGEVNHLKNSVSHAIKNALIDTKYNDERITFGQALVTHYYLNQMHQQKQASHHHLSSSDVCCPQTQSQHLHDLNKSASMLKQHQQQNASQSSNGEAGQNVVQFDLINHQLPEFKPHYGRRKLKYEEEATCVKEVFQWDDGFQESFKKMKLRELQRSPQKWQSEQRDQYRVFVDHNTAMNMERVKVKQEEHQVQAQPRVVQQEDPKVQTAAVASVPAETQDIQAAPSIPIIEEGGVQDHHSRKVRINKEALKKRAQSAKHKVKADPTRDNYKGPTRWLPDSAFTTYFGKPAFHAYGMGNVNPVVGGNIYGQYMLSHNVNPESGNNMPQYQQVYKNALQYGLKKNNGQRQPELPRKPVVVSGTKMIDPEVRTAAEAAASSRNPIMPEDGPRTVSAKLGSNKVQTIKILRPTTEKQPTIKNTSSKSSLQNNPKQLGSKKSPTKQIRSGEAVHQIEVNQQQELDLQPHLIEFEHEPQQPDFSHADFAIDENQDIGDADHQVVQQQQNHQQHQEQENEGAYYPLCEIPTGKQADLKELDPRYYQFAPACWTQRIRPAGRQTFKSEKLYSVLTGGATD